MNLINELRELAEDLYVNGYNRYSAAMSKAADELGSLQRYRIAYNEWVDKTEWVQADTSLPAKYLGMHRADVLKDMISDLLDRLEAAEQTAQDYLRIDREKAQIAQRLEAAEKERDDLRAKIAEMEKQEPVALVKWQPIETAPRNQAFLAVLNCAGEQTICTMRWPVAEAKNSRPDSKTFHVERVTHWMPLPDLPGAQPAPSERGITTGALSEMFLTLDGRDKAQPGYEWRKGWNDAIRRAMDYAQPAPKPSEQGEEK